LFKSAEVLEGRNGQSKFSEKNSVKSRKLSDLADKWGDYCGRYSKAQAQGKAEPLIKINADHWIYPWNSISGFHELKGQIFFTKTREVAKGE
jgi:hypothetical protein